MGELVDGKWEQRPRKTDGGRYSRRNAQCRNFIQADPTSQYPAAANRYHLYVSLACPWAHRTLIMKRLKGLDSIIPTSQVEPLMLEYGWAFGSSANDTANGARYIHQIYALSDPHYTGRASVPVLWDTQTKTIVSNESSEIIRMFNSEFNDFTNVTYDYYPDALAAEIDAINDQIYTGLNNGVYTCGFATSQTAYEEAFSKLFETLDMLEERLGQQRYLIGNQITEADWRLFPTLVRFDAVYFSHFKCNRNRIVDLPNLSNYLRELYQDFGIADTVDIDHCKQHYYGSHETINPTRIVPVGPTLDFDAPHDRGRFG